MNFFKELEDYSLEEIAASLTYLKQDLFRLIRASELVNCGWHAGRNRRLNEPPHDPRKESPHVLIEIAEFNSLSSFVCQSLLLPTLKARVESAQNWVLLAHQLWKMGNYDSCFPIICAMGTSPICRLKWTWQAVERLVGAELEEVREVFKVDKSYARYRDEFARLPPDQGVPLLSTLLTDLTFIMDGNPPGPDSEAKRAEFVARFTDRCAAWARPPQPRPLLAYQLHIVYFGVALDCDMPILESLWFRAFLQASPIHRLLHASPASEDQLYPQSLQLEPRDWDGSRELKELLESREIEKPDRKCGLQ